MKAKTRHYSILVVDVEGFGARADPVQKWVRDRLYGLLEDALDEAGIDHRAEPRPTDRGDGAFWLLPGTVSKVDLTGRFIDLLQAGLRAHARTSSATGAIRLRVALHLGEVAWDGRGWVGTDLNTACRIVDLPVLRDALKAGHRSGLAVAASDEWYRAVLRHDYPETAAGAYRPVPFQVKEIRDATVWIRVPGYDEPPGLPLRGGTVPAGNGDRIEDRASDDTGDVARSGGRSHAGPFAGADIRAQQVVAGDQTVHGSLTFGEWTKTPGRTD